MSTYSDIPSLFQPGSSMSISTAGATVATTVLLDQPWHSGDSTQGHVLRPQTEWECLQVHIDETLDTAQSTVLLNEDTLAALRTVKGEDTLTKISWSVDKEQEPRMSLICKSEGEPERRARLDVAIDKRLPYGKVLFSSYDAILLLAGLGGTVFCRLYEGEDRSIDRLILEPFSESMYTCGDDVMGDYVYPYLHKGLLLYEGQILTLSSYDHETVLLVKVAKIQLEGAEGDRIAENLLGVVSGRIQEDTEVMVDERHPIPFNHEFKFNDGKSVDLRHSDDSDGGALEMVVD